MASGEENSPHGLSIKTAVLTAICPGDSSATLCSPVSAQGGPGEQLACHLPGQARRGLPHMALCAFQKTFWLGESRQQSDAGAEAWLEACCLGQGLTQSFFFRNLGKSGLRVSCLGLGKYGNPLMNKDMGLQEGQPHP